MKLTNIALATVTLISSLLVISQPTAVYASCQSTYGGGQVCDRGDVTIDKLVSDPKDNPNYESGKERLVDNLDSSYFSFEPGKQVRYVLLVKNISNIKLDTVFVKDTLPRYLKWESGANRKVERNSDGQDVDVVEYQISNLEPNQTHRQEIWVRVVNQNDIPQGTICMPNHAEAVAKDGGRDEDTATICVKNGEGEKKVLGITTMPTTGPETSVLVLAEIIGLAVVGGGYLYVARGLRK